MLLLSERVEHAIRASGHTPSSVARSIGCTPAAVSQWISGETKNIKNELLFALADATGFDARWIATGRGEPLGLLARVLGAEKLLENYASSDERGREDLLAASERAATYNKA